MRHRIDLWYESDLSAPHILTRLGFRPSDAKPLLTVEGNEVYLAFSRGTPAPVIHRWYATLRAMRADGTLARIQHRWLPDSAIPRRLEIAGLAPGTPMPD
ncbi:hypothetical protein D3C86_1283600 [compost metagenome]